MLQKTKFDVLVAGELNIDLILDALHQFPQTGKEVLADKMMYTLGSSSAIFAANLSTLGVSVAYCGCIGDDDFGKKILRDLQSKRVDTNYIIQSQTSATGITVAFNFEQDRAMVTHLGAMNELSETHITDAMLGSAKHLHVSSVFLQPALKEGLVTLFQRAKEKGLTTSLDPQWDPAEKWDCDWQNLLPLVDVFLPNKEELKYITGKANTDEAAASIKDYANLIVVKNSTEGAVAFTKEKRMEQPAFINLNFKDAIGAGDSFDAGFISGFINNKPVEECLALGAICGAINTTQYGGTTAFQSLASVKKIANETFNYIIP